MRIAQVAPLFESVPPQLYGGTERVVSYLTEELVRLGHEVTLFASADSVTSARLFAGSGRALRLAGTDLSEVPIHRSMLQHVYTQRHRFDVIHLHIDDAHIREPRLLNTTHLLTVHGRLDTPERMATYLGYPKLCLASISEAQREPIPNVNWVGNVYHGLPEGLQRPSFEAGQYLLFVGRISPEKRVDRAIEIAGRFGMPLKVAAKLDRADYAYYLSVREKLREPWVEFIGEVDEKQKGDLLRGAYALMFPVDWPEPFGLAMIEAMVCGTPVIAFRRGAVPEVVDEGLTGFVVDSVDGAVSALKRVSGLNRELCATIARERFSSRRMTREYLQIYASLQVQQRTSVIADAAVELSSLDLGHAREAGHAGQRK